MSLMLKGENHIELFNQVAARLVSMLTTQKKVIGIVFMGGLARGFADKFSDLDVMAFLNKRDDRVRNRILNYGLKEGKSSAIDVDLETHFLDDFRSKKWSEIDKWDFSNAKIVFDPEGKIKKMINAKLRVSKAFWIKRIVVCGEYVRWYCCPSHENDGTVSEAWVNRGDLVAAHYSLNYAIDLLFETVFALNKEFLPPPKWRTFYSYKLGWLPEDYENLLKEAMISKDLSARDFGRRLAAIRKMWRVILHKIADETGLDARQISKRYVEGILGQAFNS